MGIKSFAAPLLAQYVVAKTRTWASKPVQTQEKIFKKLISSAASTEFGRDHAFKEIKNYNDFKNRVSITDYEGLRSYIDKAVEGKENILWPGKPVYFAKTSGTTSGAKFIPITKESIPYHINSARDLLLHYVYHSGSAAFTEGKMIFLSGSPELDNKNGVLMGRLSGIVNHHVPNYLQKNRVPSYKTNCIEDWEEKVDAIVKESLNEDMRLISGIPPWMITYFEKLIEIGGKTVGELFPNLELIVHGGVNYAPYSETIKKLMGRDIPSLETFPASEGFFAYQDTLTEEGLLLLLNNGMFYEFIPFEEIHNEQPTRLSIEDVEVGEKYALIINSNAGLWGYNIGDLVKFVSKDPYRIVVAGRIKHFISAFGENVIGEEVDKAISNVSERFSLNISEYHVAPQVNPKDGGPHHEWFIEFDDPGIEEKRIANQINDEMVRLNIYYKDLIEGNILEPLRIRTVKKGGFNEYMKSNGKLGGQNKLPRLANDRSVADDLLAMDIIENQ